MLTLDVLRGDESGIDEMSVDTYLGMAVDGTFDENSRIAE